ncbi:vWA domain-containing protein [Vannielia litorea]|uniref:vWA domain-containing protein n=1 Tax=Vannielia litorea TaxID=1217970 RepID=UPI001BCB8BB3|nr:VWA domain-containing protein [Vannielia litorea]MBS8225976.1 VWA domain-containing protein [Vannielia litorea]
MRGLIWTLAGLFAAGPLLAQEEGGGATCEAVFADLANRFPVTLEQCEPQEVSYSLEDCTPPTSFTPGAVTTHIILAIDASGSMAGAAGSLSKMEAAKREGRSFLADVHEDIAVGLMVYGHKGTNQPEGKAESCAAREMVHGFDAPRDALEGAIAALRPVGYTPIAGALEEAGRIIAALPEGAQEGEGPVPVVYLISDGEETCDGDPVAAARALIEGGVKTTVNTIGFAVNAQTEAQLQAIAEAGGGTYYPAEDASALQRQLDAIKEAENSRHRHAYCVDLNAGRIAAATNNEVQRITACYQQNGPTALRGGTNAFFRDAQREGRPEAACAGKVQLMVTRHLSDSSRWLADRTKALNDKALAEVQAYREGAGLGAE